MALCLTKMCYECAKETMHTNGECDVCKTRAAKQHREIHFATLDSMTLEQRVRKLEEDAYEDSVRPAPFDWSQPIG
jgi:hypothetical protein